MSGIRDREGESPNKFGAPTFEDLDVFQRAYLISLDLHQASLRFPQIEQHSLADQMRGQANRSAEILPKVTASDDDRQRNSNAIC
jgi:hypothetical protein